jgi:hypothetical protein
MDSWKKEEFVALSESEKALRIFQAEQENEALSTNDIWTEIHTLEKRLKTLREQAEYEQYLRDESYKSLQEMKKILREELS